MQQTTVVKIQFYPDCAQQASLIRSMNLYRDACNMLSVHAFKDGIYDAHKLQKHYYQHIRNLGLKAQMAVSATKTVSARYKTIKEQMKNEPAHYGNYTFKRNLSWLTKPVDFHTPILELVRTRDWSFQKDKLSLNTLDGRIYCTYCSTTNKGVLNLAWKFGTGCIIHRKRKWYFYVPITKEVDAAPSNNVVGIDRGIKNIYYAYDGSNETHMDGAVIQQKRRKFLKVRSSLQAKGTKGAKRALKRISGRENRWMADVNHCISKTLANKYANSFIVLENLTNISHQDEDKGKDMRRKLSSWSFYDLELKLTYKALYHNSTVIKVSPVNTSITCPCCGNIDKEARHHDKQLYICPICDFAANDDLVGAMNIRARGIELLNA